MQVGRIRLACIGEGPKPLSPAFGCFNALVWSFTRRHTFCERLDKCAFFQRCYSISQ